ncbi:hypothetical protein EDB85DRAFT_1084617 [Lactarius pseudohatsudake]|nr:hypothetical protein EDB85DRAFT_1084617 [Lactarius pseudohatsudake]
MRPPALPWDGYFSGLQPIPMNSTNFARRSVCYTGCLSLQRCRHNTFGHTASIECRDQRESNPCLMASVPVLETKRHIMNLYASIPLFRIFSARQYATKLYLSVPIYCKSGNVINELQIPRGTHLIISDIAYHRNKEIWGEDADVWRPIRWGGQVHRTQRGSVGEFVTESQMFLFEFIAGSHRKGYVDLQGDVLSMVESEERKGNQLPLKVSLISLDEQGDEGEMEIPPASRCRYGTLCTAFTCTSVYSRDYEAVGWF